MRVIRLAAESLGVRSMATYVEVGDLGILIDPGATLAPTRWGLPPAEAEWQALRRANDRISAYATRARLIFVSHYHEDHFRSDPVTYAGHTVLAKDPRRMIAGAQARRGLRQGAVQRGSDSLRPGPDATRCRAIMAHHALRDSSFDARFDVLWSTGHVITAAAHLGLPATPLEAQRRALWSDARKPPVAVRRPVETGGAIITRAKRTFARRGHPP